MGHKSVLQLCTIALTAEYRTIVVRIWILHILKFLTNAAETILAQYLSAALSSVLLVRSFSWDHISWDAKELKLSCSNMHWKFGFQARIF